MTASVPPVAHRRALARRAQVAALMTCPGHETPRILATKWLTLIAEALVDGPRGHAEIGRRVPGATQKMLTQTLRQMERDGLVTRTVWPTVPPSVDDELTDLGRSLTDLQRSILAWGRSNIDRVHDARDAYDAAR